MGEALSDQVSRLETARNDVRRAKDIHAEAQAELARMEELRTREQVQYNKAAGLPETVKRQIEMVQTQIKQTQAMQQGVQARTRELQVQAQKLASRYDHLVLEEREAETQRQKLMGQLAKKDRAVSQCTDDIAQKQIANEQLLEQQARLDLQMSQAEKAVKTVQEELQKHVRSKEALLRKLKRRGECMRGVCLTTETARVPAFQTALAIEIRSLPASQGRSGDEGGAGLDPALGVGEGGRPAGHPEEPRGEGPGGGVGGDAEEGGGAGQGRGFQGERLLRSLLPCAGEGSSLVTSRGGRLRRELCALGFSRRARWRRGTSRNC